jgi:beta-phosphoglucomutase
MKNDIAVIFDMDGVICHTNPFHSVAFKEFFLKRGLTPTDEEFALHMFGKSNSYILKHFLKREVVGEEFLLMEEEKEGLFRKIYEPHVSAVSGYLEFFNELKENQVMTGVATSAPRANLDLIFSKLGIGDRMQSILASENVTKHKPDPEVYLKSAANLQKAADQCVVFEDSFSGVTAALNAGMKVVGVLTSHTQSELPPCNMYIENYDALSFENIRSLF